MVGRTAVAAAACCCLAGSAGAFLLPGASFHKVAPARARSAGIVMSSAPPPIAEGVEMEPGLKVHPTAWKWPRSWPYTSDYFSRKTEQSIELNGTPVLTPFYDTNAGEALAKHYKRVLPANAAILELGASANSYLPGDATFSQVVGVGINEEELNANSRLTERLVKDLNEDQTLPYQDEQFDAVLIANSIEFMVKPREVIREVYRCLKPGGQLIVSFASKNKMAEDKQVKMWGNMNDDQRMWIIGSLFYFSCSEGFQDLKGFDLSESDAKGMMAGLSGKTPCHVVQCVKAEFPTDKSDIYRYMMSLLWSANDMDMDDKSLAVSRIKADYDKAETDEEREKLLESIKFLPRVYGVLAQMGGALPIQLKSLLAASVAPLMHGTDLEIEQLKQGLGLAKASEEFWAPLGKATINMSAEDKVLLLAECVPMHSGTDDEKAALTEMVDMVPKVIDVVKGVCPEMEEGDVQLLAVDLVVSDFLHEAPAERAQFLDWVKTLNKVDMEEYLRLRKEYKGAKLQAAI